MLFVRMQKLSQIQYRIEFYAYNTQILLYLSLNK